jgi:hypothetical protein
VNGRDGQETMRSMHTALGRRWLAGVVASAALVLSACGSEEPVSDANEPTPTESASVEEQASSYLLAEEDLPDGWRHATGEQHLGRPVVCGVVLEPADLASVDTIRYTKGFSGPFVIQYSFVAADEKSAAATADALVRKLRQCRSFDFEGETARVTPIRDIPPVGTGFSAVRLELSTGVARDVVTFREGTHVTVLVGYALQDLEPPAHADVAAIAETIATSA